MKNQLSEHSRKLRIETADKFNKENTGYNLNVRIPKGEIAEFARKNIPNKRKFFIECIKKYMDEKKTA